MKVLLVDPSSHGGIVTYTSLLARALRTSGADPVVLGSRALAASEDPVPVRRWLPVQQWGRPPGAGLRFDAGRARAWLQSAIIIVGAVAREKPDIVHFQAPINRRFDAHLIRVLARRQPIIWTAHDVLPFERTDADRARFATIYRAADRVIVHTQPAADQLRDLAGVDPAVIEHLPIDGLQRLPLEQARAELGLPTDGRLFSALGFIREYKGYGLLADVWEQLGAGAPQLLVMGELMAESERPVLERLARSHRVTLRLGYASERELRLAVCAADALLLPYTQSSDSGLVHLARALGVPVIASDSPQLAAAVAATEAGIVVARDTTAWATALTGELPPPPPTSVPTDRTGAEHVAVYEQARDGRGGAQALRLVIYTDAVEHGGAEQVLTDLLAELDPAIEVTVVGVTASIVDSIVSERPGSRTCLLPAITSKYDISAILAHWCMTRRLQADVFQANLRHPWSCQYGVAAALLTPGVKVIAVEHLPTPPTARLQRHLKLLISRHLDAHIAVGHRSAAELEQLIGLRQGAIEVIHNGVRENDDASNARDELVQQTLARTETQPPRLVGVGRLTRQKGFDVLIRALALLPTAELIIIGEGEERGRLERMRDELSLHGRVRLPGSNNDVPAVLASVDAFVLPSRAEAFPLVVLEAMHAGLPVVASDVGSLSEAVIAGRTGLLVPPDDVSALAGAIGRVLAPGVGAKMGANGRALARAHFTRRMMASDYERLYRRMTG